MQTNSPNYQSLAPLFLDAASETFRRILETEYYRLRAHAEIAGETAITLSVDVRFDFGSKPSVEVKTAPQYVPPPVVMRKSIGESPVKKT